MFDLVLQGALVVDGTGTPAYRANVGIQGGRIAAITSEPVSARQVLDVTGLAVAPGFIDIHSHSDALAFSVPVPENFLRQGVTTQIIGNCGSSLFPTLPQGCPAHEAFCRGRSDHPGFVSAAEYIRAIDRQGVGCNYGALAGHNNLRVTAVGLADRAPSETEMSLMEDLLDREMAQGAFGMSLGLIYAPSSFAEMDELVRLAEVIARHDGLLSVHMRNEGPRIFDALEEMLEVARRSGVRLQISHLKLMGKPQWGKAPQLLEMLENARSEGLRVTCDQYPFPASSTSMTALAPRWAMDGGKAALLSRVQAPEDRLTADIAREIENRGGPAAVQIRAASEHPEYDGKTLLELSQAFGTDPAQAVCRILLETSGSCSCIYFSMDRSDMHRIMEKDWVCAGSDSSNRLYSSPGRPHPRNIAAFSQYFQTVREHRLLPLEAMVRKASGLTADILGLKDRGILKEGNWADIAVFDPQAYGSTSTFLQPCSAPTGMHHVLVNGQFAVKHGQLTGTLSGMGLRKK